MERYPQWRGVHSGGVSIVEVSTVERCLQWRGVHSKVVTIMERCP